MDPRHFPVEQTKSGSSVFLILILIVVILIVSVGIYFYMLPPNIDCVMSEWSECDYNGQQTRTIITPASGTGKVCGDLTQSCIAPVDCVMSEWAPCDYSGTQTRTITGEASGTGKACGNLTQSCIAPVDCVMSEWTPCDSTGTQTRTITNKASGTGKACGDLTQSCIAPVDCVLSDWGYCDLTGNQARTITTPTAGTGKACGDLTQTCTPVCIGFQSEYLFKTEPILKPDSTLKSCEGLKSPDGSHIFVLQTDGNLVLYNKISGIKLWQSNTANLTNKKLPFSLTYEANYNLVLSDSNNEIVWNSGTQDKPSEKLELENNGHLTLKQGNTIVWSSGFYFITSPDLEKKGQLIFNVGGVKSWLDGKNGALNINKTKSSDPNQQWYINHNNKLVMNAGSGTCFDFNNARNIYLNGSCNPANDNQRVERTLDKNNNIIALWRNAVGLDVGNGTFRWWRNESNPNQVLTNG